MPYIYDEKTGDFINTSSPKPEVKKTTVSSSSTTRTTNSTSSSSNSGGSFFGGLLAGIGVLLIQFLPYLIIAGLVSLCS